MEIDTNMNLGSINGQTAAKRPAASSAEPPAAQGDSFASSSTLESALNTVPDVRSSEVDRARSLIADPSYPSADVVKKLSGFLASQLQANS